MAMDDLSYRFALRLGEEQRIREITTSVGVFYPDEVEVAAELAREHLAQGAERSGYHYVLAERRGMIVGYTCFGPIPCTKTSYDLYWIVVDDSHRGLGLGRRLLTRSEERIAALGGTRVYVETSSRELYYPTRQFYRQCGYREEAMLHDYYDQGDHKVIYVRRLQEGEVADVHC